MLTHVDTHLECFSGEESWGPEGSGGGMSLRFYSTLLFCFCFKEIKLMYYFFPLTDVFKERAIFLAPGNQKINAH